jgi:hypothetical protein
MLLVSVSAFASGDYKAEAAGEIPSEVAAPIRGLLDSQGARIVGEGGQVFAEVWLRKSVTLGADSGQANTTLGTLPHGTVMGVLRFPGNGGDRRGQTVKPGVYVLRHSLFPINGDHQGVAPQRDFLVLTRAADDSSAEPIADFDALMTLSRKASGTPHPAVLSYWKEDSVFQAGLSKGQSDEEWIWMAKAGDLPLAIIVVGKGDH